MRKLKLQVQVTLDGFMAGPNGEMDWVLFNWSDDLINYVRQITDSVDTVLLGRKLAEGFIPHWENVAKNPEDQEYEAGIKFTTTPKIVFTKTLNESIWKNTILAKGELAEEIEKLKSQNGKDLIAYGGETFVSSLIRSNLIDELHFFINPSAIGKGMSIFKDITVMQSFKLISANQFDCGIVVMVYSPN